MKCNIHQVTIVRTTACLASTRRAMNPVSDRLVDVLRYKR
ncbi:hypothetical protein RIEGSTA812A_PEG_983 [invertebrate metagenome]|uniref:Uncharacterized protein n=1 Tax=invertebrate metagenome TaxID=1711999 RepID=A0A484H7E4_9ZZZZ